jgi:hypothetical protein
MRIAGYSETTQSMPPAPTLEQLAAKKHPKGSIFNAFPAIGSRRHDDGHPVSQLRRGERHHLGQRLA